MDCTAYDEVRTLLEKYYDELDRTDSLEPISKVRTVQKLSCESSAYVKKQTAGT
ncbi:MAG: hypothetical protein RIF34_03610 [Candidatus Kapaibacterium sp.]